MSFNFKKRIYTLSVSLFGIPSIIKSILSILSTERLYFIFPRISNKCDSIVYFKSIRHLDVPEEIRNRSDNKRGFGNEIEETAKIKSPLLGERSPRNKGGELFGPF